MKLIDYDIFGSEIKLRFFGEDSYKTKFGAILSITYIILIIGILIKMIYEFFLLENRNITYKFETNKIVPEHKLNNSNFYYAVTIKNVLNEPIANMNDFISLKYYDSLEDNNMEVKLENCNDKHKLLFSATSNIIKNNTEIKNNYKCYDFSWWNPIKD
jgi:hypothetical protein